MRNIFISEASEWITLSKVRSRNSGEDERKVSSGGPIRERSSSSDHVMENVDRRGAHMFSRRLLGTCPDPVRMSDTRFYITAERLGDGVSTSAMKSNVAKQSSGHAVKMSRIKDGRSLRPHRSRDRIRCSHMVRSR